MSAANPSRSVVFIAAVLLVSCKLNSRLSSETEIRPVTKPTNDEQTTQIIARIHEGMTFRQINELIPLPTNGMHIVEHGGIWYTATVGTNVIQFRFAHPAGNFDTANFKLNLPPQVKPRPN